MKNLGGVSLVHYFRDSAWARTNSAGLLLLRAQARLGSIFPTVAVASLERRGHFSEKYRLPALFVRAQAESRK